MKPTDATVPLDPATARLLAASVATEAGRFLIPLPIVDTQLPAAPRALFVVHVGMARLSFRVHERPVTPRMLAKLVRACPEWRGRPVLIVTPGRSAGQPWSAGLFASMATALNVPVYSCDSAVHQAVGRLVTPGQFSRWSPSSERSGGSAAVTLIGSVLPETMPSSPPVDTDGLSDGDAPGGPSGISAPLPPTESRATLVEAALALLAPASSSIGALSEIGETVEHFVPIAAPQIPRSVQIPPVHVGAGPPELTRTSTPDRRDFGGPIAPAFPLEPAVEPEHPTAVGRHEAADRPEPLGSPVASALSGTQWIKVVSSAHREDRERLRSVLGWRYEAHARAVTGALALQPGLRLSATTDDLLAGLVAVRAHLSTSGASVDATLRGESMPETGTPPVAGPDVRLLARCAASGLDRLPVVVGPVFRPGTPDAAVLRLYRSGLRLVEPAFTEARINRQLPSDSTVEYAIWSSTGRRTDLLITDEAGSAPTPIRVLFRAGTHFVVLGVEESTEKTPVRVLLREVTEASPTSDAVDERAHRRLLEVVNATVPVEPGPATSIPLQWRHPLGADAKALPFALSGGQR